jgi:hypothetical protein
MGLLGVARANTAVGVSPETFLLLLLLQTPTTQNTRVSLSTETANLLPGRWLCRNEGVAVLPSVQCALHRLICALSRAALWAPQVMLDLDAKGGDWNGQVKLGAPSFLGINYFQSVTPRLAAGGEFFWLQVQGRRFWFGRSFGR